MVRFISKVYCQTLLSINLPVHFMIIDFDGTVNSRFKKDFKLQITYIRPFFSDDQFLDSLHKSFLNQATLDLRKKKNTFLDRDFTVHIQKY